MLTIKKMNIFQNSISSTNVRITNFRIGGGGIQFPQVLIFWTFVLIQLFDTGKQKVKKNPQCVPAVFTCLFTK